MYWSAHKTATLTSIQHTVSKAPEKMAAPTALLGFGRQPKTSRFVFPNSEILKTDLICELF